MAVVASRELQNHTRALLDRVDAGEVITIASTVEKLPNFAPLLEKADG